jgi:4-hydroxybenzoate polyprenyltransferase
MKPGDTTVDPLPGKEHSQVSRPKSTSNLMRSFILFTLAHKGNLFSWGWATLIGCFIAGRGFPSILSTIGSLSAVLAITLSVYTFNDVIDAEMDKINPKKRNRPLPSGLSTKKDAMLLTYIMGIIGVVISLFLNRTSFILCLAYLLLFTLYSHPVIRLKKRFVIKELTVASGYILTTLIGGFAVAGKYQSTFVFAGVLYFFFSFMGMPAFHDITDVKEDEIFGVKTMAIVLSWRRKVQMLMLFILTMMTLTPFTYTRLGFNAALPVVIVAMGLIVLRYLIPLSNAFERSLFIKTRNISYVYYILIHVVLVISTINM